LRVRRPAARKIRVAVDALILRAPEVEVRRDHSLEGVAIAVGVSRIRAAGDVGIDAHVVADTSAGAKSSEKESEMTGPYSRINLADVGDAAPANGFGDRWEARVARGDLHAEETGLTHFRLHPGKRSPFMHRHRRSEEVYVILGGSGQIKLDDELFDVQVLDAVRVAPEVARAFEAGPEGL